MVVVVEVAVVVVVVIGPVVDGFSPDGSELPVPGLVGSAPDSGEEVVPDPLWDCGTGFTVDGSEPDFGPVGVADPEFEPSEVGLSVWEITGREGATTFPSSATVEDGGAVIDRVGVPAVGTCTEPGNVTFAVESDPCAALTMARVPMIATTPGTAHQGPFTGFPWGGRLRPTTAIHGNRTGSFAS